MVRRVSPEAASVRDAIVTVLKGEGGPLSVKVIAGRLEIEPSRAKYNVLVLEQEKRVRRIDGVAGIYYDIAP